MTSIKLLLEARGCTHGHFRQRRAINVPNEHGIANVLGYHTGLLTEVRSREARVATTCAPPLSPPLFSEQFFGADHGV